MGWKIQGSIACRDKRLFSSPKHPDWLWGPPCLLLNGLSVFPQGYSGFEANHLPPSNAKVTNEWNYASMPM
jgi:hypothetical protein